jgi:hypothetical protein
MILFFIFLLREDKEEAYRIINPDSNDRLHQSLAIVVNLVIYNFDASF